MNNFRRSGDYRQHTRGPLTPKPGRHNCCAGTVHEHVFLELRVFMCSWTHCLWVCYHYAAVSSGCCEWWRWGGGGEELNGLSLNNEESTDLTSSTLWLSILSLLHFDIQNTHTHTHRISPSLSAKLLPQTQLCYVNKQLTSWAHTHTCARTQTQTAFFFSFPPRAEVTGLERVQSSESKLVLQLDRELERCSSGRLRQADRHIYRRWHTHRCTASESTVAVALPCRCAHSRRCVTMVIYTW